MSEQKLTYAEYKKILEKDENGCYVSLVIPAQGDRPALDLRGKRPADYTLDEIIRMKKYAGALFAQVDPSTM